SEIFTTASDNQPNVEIDVLQGEAEMADHNKSLGRFQLTDIPTAPRGMPQIEVTFDIDANGIVNVHAKDLGTGKQQSMTITGGTKLDVEEIDKMMKDAEAHAEEDKQRRAAAEARNQADSIVYQTEKSMKEHGDKLDESDRKTIEDALAEAKEALSGTDVDAIKRTSESLMTASQKFAEVIYKQAQQQSAEGTPGTPGASGGNDDVVDAEVVDEGDEKQSA
ncbi:MAG: Hsp70 family protein, partial [Actinomycetota bacterium]